MEVNEEIDRTIYHVHPITGEFIGTGEARLDPIDNTFLLIPAHATQEKPPAAGERQVATWKNGEWFLTPDYRGVVYSIADGAASPHDTIGELPEGFTHREPPGQDFAWNGEGWELDDGARAARLAGLERSWRNDVLERLRWLRDRHRDEQEIGEAPTLTPEQFSDLLAYMHALRQWPQSKGFPDVTQRPAPSTSLAAVLGG